MDYNGKKIICVDNKFTRLISSTAYMKGTAI